jgi:hypothetical protein
MVSGTEVMRLENSAPRGAVMPERRARPWADDPAFAGPRSPAPRAEGGASDTRACRAHKLLWLCLVVSTQHPMLALRGCQSFFSLSRLPLDRLSVRADWRFRLRGVARGAADPLGCEGISSADAPRQRADTHRYPISRAKGCPSVHKNLGSAVSRFLCSPRTHPQLIALEG